MATNLNEWQGCESGHLKRIVSRLQTRRLVRALKRDVAVGTVLIACVLSSYVGIDAWAKQPADLGGVLCFEISKLRDMIVRNDLIPEVEVCVHRHLAICAHCRANIQLARLEYLQGAPPAPKGAVIPAEGHVAARDVARSSLFSTVGY